MRRRHIDKIYNPKKVEDKWYDFWLKKNYFAAKPAKEKKSYGI